MKLYTRAGDDGSTGLCGNVRVSKAGARVEAYGSVDETNAAIGLVVSMCDGGEMVEQLRRVQAQLFTVGAQLATAPGQPSDVGITTEDIGHLEQWIDQAVAPVPELRSFILPGGFPLASGLHFARAVCRRAERAVVRLSESQQVEAVVVTYLNRLSDLLFALARLANHEQGASDIPWVPRRG